MASDDKKQIDIKKRKYKRNTDKIEKREAARAALEAQHIDTTPEPLKDTAKLKSVIDSIEDKIMNMYDTEVLTLVNDLGVKELKTNQYVYCLGQVNKKYISKELLRCREDNQNEFLLYALTNIYIEIITKYDFISSIDAYCTFIGIVPFTFNRWESGDAHGYKYYTPDGEPIYSVSAFKANNPGAEYIQELSFAHSDISKMIRNLGRSNVRNKLADSPLGVTVLANNDRETGLRYNAQSMLESATIQKAISANNLPQLE